MDDFRPPKPLSFDGDIATGWQEWRQRFELFLEAKEATGKSDATRITMLLTAIGPEGIRRFNNFQWATGEDKTKFDHVIQKFETELNGEKRIVFNRYQFWDYKRGDHQMFDDFLTVLRTMAKTCDFQEEDNMIRDKIIFTLTDKRLKERLLREKDVDLKRTIQMCKAAEVTHQELVSMTKSVRSVHVSSVKCGATRSVLSKPVQQAHGRQEKGQRKQASKSSSDSSSGGLRCRRCNFVHGDDLPNVCPAWGKTCRKCSGRNHFQVCCRSKRVHAVDVRHDPDSGEETESSDEFFIGPVYRTVGSTNRETTTGDRAWYDTFDISGSHIKMKVDTGAETNSIPFRTWRKITDRPKLVESNTVLRAFGGSVVKHLGVAHVPIKYNDRSVITELFITEGDTVPILGFQSCVALGLVSPQKHVECTEFNLGSDDAELDLSETCTRLNLGGSTELNLGENVKGHKSSIKLNFSDNVKGHKSCTKLDFSDNVKGHNSIEFNLGDKQCFCHSDKKMDSISDPITMDTLKTDFKEAFEGRGCYPTKCHITRKPDSSGYIETPHRVPQRLMEPLKSKLDEMVSQKIIVPVDKPTDFVSNLVITQKKDGSLRLCLDPKFLNDQIKREHFQIPTFDDIVSNLGGKKYFTVLDQKDSYWQVELDEDSAPLTTFSTPFGRFMFLRMPFGISCAAEILQKKTYQVFGAIPDTHMIADDMLIASDTEVEHDNTLRTALNTAIQSNVKFKLSKTQLKQSSVSYYGHELGKDGLRPDPSKVKAIVEMPDPTDQASLKRLMGMLNFLSKFIPNKASVVSPMSNLLKSGVEWTWGPAQQQAMAQIKIILSNEPVLKLFESQKPVTIQADASSTGLGACLLQDDRPIAYASRALTDSETRYAQIEKELLAIVFAANKFHHYIYGTSVEVESDHKPLESILKKPIHQASPRIQIMMLRLMRYNLEVKYVPGSRLYIADTLSRAYVNDSSIDTESQIECGKYRIHSVTEHYPASPQRLEELREATRDDLDLQKLRNFVYHGWPSHRSSVPSELHPYWQFRSEIHEENGLLFINERLIIPSSMRPEMLTRVHQGHAGTEKCKARASGVMYWPNMSRDIELKVAKCPVCLTYSRSNQREPMIPHEMPTRPWAKLGTDLLEFGGKDYLVIVDYFSKYPEVVRLSGKSASCVISALKSVYARHGIPDTLISDNMPFASELFAQFADEWGFELVTSSPTYSQSNGMSERYVQTVKGFLKRALAEGQDIHLSLLEYRNTPLAGIGASPAQLLMSRRLKDTLPSTSSLLSPQVVSGTGSALAQRQASQKRYYDRGTKHLKSHKVGADVRVRLGKTWEHAQVTGIHDTPRSYLVTTEDGRTYRRNQRVLKHSPDKACIIDDPVLEPMSQPPLAEARPQGPIQTPFPDPPSPMTQGDPDPLVPTPKKPPDSKYLPSTDGVVDSQLHSPVRRSNRSKNAPKWHRDYMM